MDIQFLKLKKESQCRVRERQEKQTNCRPIGIKIYMRMTDQRYRKKKRGRRNHERNFILMKEMNNNNKNYCIIFTNYDQKIAKILVNVFLKLNTKLRKICGFIIHRIRTDEIHVWIMTPRVEICR